MSSTEPRRRFHEYQDLMRYRIMDILLVSTPYDTFILEEAGELAERMLGEFRNLDLHYAPALTGVTSGAAAVRLACEQRRINLIITTPHLPDMDAAELAKQVREAGLDIPVVLLAWDTRELREFEARADTSLIDRTFLWQGDARILVAIVKSVEDRRNVEHDTRSVGVQVILLIEDNVRYYSSFLPLIYAELLQHSRRVVKEGLNLSQQILRMRARPKILLCTTWEEAVDGFDKYAEDVLGIISDVQFPRGGVKSAQAGADLARHVGAAYPDVPIILHSSRPENEALAESVGCELPAQGLAPPPAGAPEGDAGGLRVRRLRLQGPAGEPADLGLRPETAWRRSWPWSPPSRSSATRSATTSRAGSRHAPSSPSPTTCARAA